MSLSTHGPIWTPSPLASPRLRLLCLPYAGAGASVFRGWDGVVGDDVEVSALQLPGREWRRREPLATRMEALVAQLVNDLTQWLEQPQPYALFGYSMGAGLAFALVRQLRQLGMPLPVGMVLAACRAPQLLSRMKAIYHLDDEQFLAAIRRFGGMPDAVLAEPDLLALVLPVLRADFEILGSYQVSAQAPLAMPMLVYGGTQDPHASKAELAAWREQAGGTFNLRLFSGGHFFINECRAQVQRTLAADLSSLCPQRRARIDVSPPPLSKQDIYIGA